MDNPIKNPQTNFIVEGESDETNLNLRHYWHVILERRWLVIVTFISVFILALIYVFKAPRVYRATSRLQIDREYENVLNTTDGFVADSREQDYLQTQYKNLLSRSLIEQVSNKLNLYEDPRYADNLNKLQAVMDDITVTPIRLSRLVDVSVEHTDPKQAQLIANTLVETFIQNNLDHKMEKSLSALHYLQTEAATMENKVTDAEKRVQEYKEEIDTVSLDKDQDMVLQTLNQTRQDLAQAEIEATAAQSVAADVEEAVKNEIPLTSIPQISKDPRIAGLQTELDKLNAQLEALLVKYKDKWPDVQKLRQNIAAIEESIQNRAKELYRTIQLEAEQKWDKVENLKTLAAGKEQQALQLNQYRIEYDNLSRRAEQQRLAFKTVLSRMEEVNITSKSKTNNMRQVDPAALPLYPVKPRIILTLLLGIVGGCAAGIGLAFFVNYLDDSVKTQDDVETYLKLAFLGYIPNIKTNSLIERDLQSHLYPQSSAAESFRTLRATISLMPRGDDYHVVALTSTIPSEGKSLVASNLAIVFAQTGLRTVLLDADLRRPSVHKAFQLHSPTGLSGFLNNEITDPASIVQSCEVPNLDVVCCGAAPDNPSEMIGSRKMTEFLKFLREKYDRIVVDCPPVSAVSDPLILAAKADGVVFVSKFNKIRREHARRTIQRIQDAGIRILGVILNDIDFEGRDSYYYSYYYYQNRYYASHYRTANSDDRKSNGKPKAELRT